jgi:signal transduction histidine kinase
MRANATAAHMVELPAADELGRLVAEEGRAAGDAVRTVVALGEALIAVAGAAGALAPDGVTHLRGFVVEAAARAADGHAGALEERRESWLSYLSHQLKNPVNTVMNALWLVREQGAAPESSRFLDLAERALRKMEAEIAQLRQLHRLAREPPPASEARPPRF